MSRRSYLLVKRLSVRTRRYLAYALLTCTIVALASYVTIFRHKTLRIEGELPISISEFGDGATVSHAFLMDDDKLHAVSVRIVAAEPSSLLVACKLLRLYDRESGAENNPGRYTEVYRWTVTLSARAGERWQRIAFPAVDDSGQQWYRFEMRLIEATADRAGRAPHVRPSVSLVASADNPFRGGKLWIGGIRQPGSLFIRADGATLYERFLLRVQPGLPVVLHNRAIQAALALVYLWAFVTLAYAMLFARTHDSDKPAFHPWPESDRAGSWRSAVALGQVAILSVALALFFLAPESPASSLPLFPELLLFGTLCVIAGASFPSSLSAGKFKWLLRRDEKLWWAFLALCFGLTVYGAIQSGMGSHLGFDPCGSVAPSLFVRLECRLQASASQNYAWRNLSLSTLMLVIGVAAALTTRTVPGFWRRAITAVVLVGLVHAAIGFEAERSWTPQILPKWIMVNSYGFDRFTFLIPHPGYVWPQLGPALAISVWLLTYGASRTERLIGLVASLVVAAAICGTRQRGGLLLVGTLVLLSFAATIVKATRELGGRKGTYAAIRLSTCCLICTSLFYPLFVSWSQWGARFMDPYRLGIWKGVVDGVLREHPLFGFGYARWGEFARIAVGTPAESVLDTSHSLWIRVLFELGFVGLVLLVVCVLGAVGIAARNASRLRGGVFLVMCATVAFLISATFEEVDYVRPVFVMHAFLAGVCCGLPFRQYGTAVNASRFDGVDLAEDSVSNRWTMTARTICLALVVFSVGAALATRLYFTTGAMEFDGAGAAAEPRARWLGQRSTIPVYGPERLWVFKTDVLTRVGKIRLVPPSGEAVSLDVTAGDQAYLPMFTNGRFWPRRHSILFERGHDAWYRQVAGQIVYPPILVPVPLLMTRNASDPEPADGGLSVRCLEECTLAVLHNPGDITTARLALEPLFPPPAGGQAVEVASFVTMSRDAQISMSAAPDWVPLDKIVYKSSGAFEPIALAIPADSPAYKIRITTLHPPANSRTPIMKVVVTESAATVSN